ncbi:MAG: 3-isopropylmalate dehydrogenase [Myxococcales bacterium]|nr:3-isopropylmalate dehydrogenase [Myxococcales bacterium]
MKFTVAVLAGDGVGPEVVEAAIRVGSRAAELGNAAVEWIPGAIGGAAIESDGDPLPESTLSLCRGADAVLLGAVGGPRWSDPNAAVRPEQGLLRIRKAFDLFANLRPVKIFPALAPQAPLRPELLEGVDILFVRELTSGIYFGPRQEENPAGEAWDTMRYSVEEVERVARVAFEAARTRRRHVVSVDKANVLASMRLWRRTISRVARDYPDVGLEHQLVDSFAMQQLTRPRDFDVVVTGNLFGDILSDAAAVLAGSLGMLPSASLNGDGFGLYEPIHGSAPDIAGRKLANPLGTILSVALLFRHSLGLDRLATAIENAVERALDSGARTRDIARGDEPTVTTDGMADVVLESLHL